MKKKNLMPLYVVIILVVIYFGASVILKQKIVKEFNNFTNTAGISDGVKYKKLSVSPLSMSGKFEDMTITQESAVITIETLDFNSITNATKAKKMKVTANDMTIDVDEFNIKKYVIEDGVPKAADIAISGIQIPIISEQARKDLGTNQLVVDFDIETDTDFDKQTFEYKKLDVVIKNLADFKMNLAFSGIDLRSYTELQASSPEALQNNPEFIKKIQEDMVNLKVNNFKLSFFDKGLIDKIFMMNDLGENISLKERKEKFIEQIDADMDSLNSNFEKKVAEDVKKFITENKKEVIISLKPNEPISFQEIIVGTMFGMSIDEMVETTGLEYQIK